MKEKDKSLIKKLDKQTDLLGKAPVVGDNVKHRVPFPGAITVVVKKPNVSKAITAFLKPYAKRNFYLSYDNYGVEASVNYENGVFNSLILKGTGHRGERLNDRLALKLVPRESAHKGNVTLHVFFTVEREYDQVGSGIPPHEVPQRVKAALRAGEARVDEEDIVCRVTGLWLDTVQVHAGKVSAEVNPEFTPVYNLPVNYEELEEWLEEMIAEASVYHLPIHGFIITDEDPTDPDSFPETHFLYHFPRHDH